MTFAGHRNDLQNSLNIEYVCKRKYKAIFCASIGKMKEHSLLNLDLPHALNNTMHSLHVLFRNDNIDRNFSLAFLMP